MRERLPDRRKNMTQRVKVNGQTVHFTVGFYEDGRPGELFINMHRTGTQVRAWCEATAKLISLMLQYGVPLSELVECLVGHGTEPFGSVPVHGHPLIHEASGVLDAVMQAMAVDFLAKERAVELPDHLSAFLSQTADLEAMDVWDLAEERGVTDELQEFLAKFAEDA